MNSCRTQNRVVVIGASGFIGSAVYSELLNSGTPAVGLDLRPSNNVDPIDILDTEALEQAIPIGSTIVHLAGPVAGSFEKDMAMPWRLQVDGTSSVLRAAAARQCKRLVFGSSYHVYMQCPKDAVVDESSDLPMENLDAFGTSKLVSEQLASEYCRHAGIDLVTLRFGSVYGLGQCTNLIGDLFTAYLTGKNIEIWGEGERTNHYVDVSDLARACVLAVEAPTGLYNVLNPRRYTVREICDVAETVFGITISYRPSAKERPSFATILADRFQKATPWKPTELEASFRRILRELRQATAA